MRSTTRLLAALAAAGVVAATGNAFTADLELGTDEMAPSEVFGYGSVSATNATLKNVAYNVSTSNSSLLSNVTFHVVERVDDQGNKRYNAIMTLNGTSGTQTSCTRTWVAASSHTSVVCTPTTSPTVSSVTGVHLAISPA